MKNALVCGAGGFIGGHLVKRLKSDGYYVRGVDIKKHEYSKTLSDDFIVGDLCCDDIAIKALEGIDIVFQLAADMGGAGYIFTGNNDANVMYNSCKINLNVLEFGVKAGVKKFFYSSSACAYPEFNQTDPNNPNCSEDSAYPAQPDSEYGWEKLFSERLFLAYSRNHGVDVHIARFHNIFGPEGTWDGGREKAPAAMCRKVAEAENEIEIWGDGLQTRSFLYVDECVEGVMRLVDSNWSGPVNIGSDEMITINDLAKLVMKLANKDLSIKNVDGPLGVRGRCSDNELIGTKLGWKPNYPLIKGLEKTYPWICDQLKALGRID